jgi:ABC-type nitrate/sulfonate/bicarbonate transport system substrate-binding protein
MKSLHEVAWPRRRPQAVLLTALVVGALTLSVRWAFADQYVPADPESGTDIPATSVTFGMRPYADNTFYVIAMKKGWFKDVGITIMPGPEGMKVTDTNVNALLLNRQLDISSQYCPLMLPIYKTSDRLKCIAFTDNFLGMAILANPKLGLKGFGDYIAAGKSFEEAIKTAMAPMEGKTLVGAPQLSDRPFNEAVSQYSGITWKLDVMDDAKALVLAKAGRIDFANPEGAPIVYTLMQDGWTVLVNNGHLYDYAPAGSNSPIQKLVAIVGIGANGDFVNKNQNTVLRFLSVVWRTIDAVKKDPSLFKLQAPYLNSVAGTSLDASGVEATIKSLDPLSPFEYGSTYFEDKNSVLYWLNAWPAIIKDYVAHDVVPQGAVSAEDFVWAAPIWKQVKGYRDKTDELLAKLAGQELGGDKRALVDKAKQYYEWYDFLDAYRLALAASR